MSAHPLRNDLVVLKFGGSVLQDEASLDDVVQEIYAQRRAGARVVAVVSAFAGTTDRLHRALRFERPPTAPHAAAAALALGEAEACARLGIALDRAGVAASVLPEAGIRARGKALDAEPVDCDVGRIERALERDGVAVVPGFVAKDPAGRTVLLGRGGSDLSAVVLAGRLGASCRLVKDVDGLYESDPRAAEETAPERRPSRYLEATWETALATDGSILQHKAIHHAERAGIPFLVGGLQCESPTEIGSETTRLAKTPDAAEHGVREVALLGFGSVGRAVYRWLAERPSQFRVVGIAVRDRQKARQAGAPPDLLTTEPLQLAEAGTGRIVLEVLGGIDTALAAATSALRAGNHVVTANKALLAAHGEHLRELASEQGVRLLGSASVGGATPVLETARALRQRGRSVVSVRAVLNGTTNHVLESCRAGLSVASAIEDARSAGFAEADTSRDLDGRDAADKLCLLARALGWPELPLDAIELAPLTESGPGAAPPGHVFRQVATLSRDTESGTPKASVRITAVDPRDALFDLPGERNATLFELASGERRIVHGRGAGGTPTATAVVADILDLCRSRRGGTNHREAQSHRNRRPHDATR